MVARVHHATAAKAAKLGFIIEDGLEDAVYTVRWPERNRVVTGTDAPQALRDMALVKTLALEYPQYKARQVADGWEIRNGDMTVAGGETLEVAWDLFTGADGWDPEADAADADEDEDDDADDIAEGEANDEESEEEPEEDDGKSVVKKSYKRKYRRFHATCGDEISDLVKEYLAVKDEDGRVRQDNELLEVFAKANDVWNERYRSLNPGMQRMNVTNRLRTKIRRDNYEIVWA